MKYFSSFLVTFFTFILVGPVIGGLWLIFEGGIGDWIIRIPLLYLGGLIPAALAGVIYWSIMLGFHIAGRKNYYWPSIAGSSIIMLVLFIITTFPSNQLWHVQLIGIFVVLPVWACAQIAHGRAWDILDT